MFTARTGNRYHVSVMLERLFHQFGLEIQQLVKSTPSLRAYWGQARVQRPQSTKTPPFFLPALRRSAR